MPTGISYCSSFRKFTQTLLRRAALVECSRLLATISAVTRTPCFRAGASGDGVLLCHLVLRLACFLETVEAPGLVTAGPALPLSPPGRPSGPQRVKSCIGAALAQPLLSRRALPRRPLGRSPSMGILIAEGVRIVIRSLLREPGMGRLGLAPPP